MHIASVAAQFACRIHVIDILPNLVPTLLSLLPPLRVSTKVLNFVYIYATSLPHLFSYQLIANEVLHGNLTSSTIHPMTLLLAEFGWNYPWTMTTTAGEWCHYHLGPHIRSQLPLSTGLSSSSHSFKIYWNQLNSPYPDACSCPRETST